jgi:hypothetical protein
MRYALVLLFAAACSSHSPPATAPDLAAALPDAAVALGPGPVDAGADAAMPFSYQFPAGVMTCYSMLADNDPATTGYWTTVFAADYASRPAATQALANAAAAHPMEEEFALLNGLANLWRVAEPAPSEMGDLIGTITHSLTAKSELERAFNLCPTDYRIPAWLGPLDVMFGEQGGGQTFIDQGMMVLNTGIMHYPSFVLFSKLLVFADKPASDPGYQMALQAVDDNISACGDLTTTHDPACLNSPHAVHNIEGSVTYLGDAYAKAGRRADALAMYAGATRSTTYSQWKYQDYLNDHINNIDARIAAYGAGQDPGAAWNSKMQCSLCHQQ